MSDNTCQRCDHYIRIVSGYKVVPYKDGTTVVLVSRFVHVDGRGFPIQIDHDPVISDTSETESPPKAPANNPPNISSHVARKIRKTESEK